MRHIALVLALMLAGCRSMPIPPEMVSMHYKPKKSGVVRVGDQRSAATKLMTRFCAPDRPEILEISHGSVATGSTTTVMPRMSRYMPAVASTREDYQRVMLVNFECVESSDDDEI